MKLLNEQTIKRLQKLAGISEIRVKAPNNGIINIITEYGNTNKAIRDIIIGEFAAQNVRIQINKKHTFISNYIANMGHENNNLYLEISIIESNDDLSNDILPPDLQIGGSDKSYVNDLDLLKKLCNQYKIPNLPQDEDHILLVLKPEEYNILAVNKELVTSYSDLK